MLQKHPCTSTLVFLPYIARTDFLPYNSERLVASTSIGGKQVSYGLNGSTDGRILSSTFMLDNT